MADPGLTMRERVAKLRLPEFTQTSGARPSIGWLPWVLCLLLAFSTLSLFIRSFSAPPASTTTVSSSRSAAKTPNAAPVAKTATEPGGTVLESKGYIIAAHQIQVSPIEVSGRILELYIEEGKLFQAGQPLAILDSASYEADYLDAQAVLEQAQVRHTELKNGARPEEIDQMYAELNEAREVLKQVKLEYERNKHIANGALSAQEFEKAQYAFSAQSQRVNRLEKMLELVKIGPRKERIDAAAAEVKSAEAKVKRAKWRLDNCVIRAPVTGTILKKTAEIGNLVSPLSFNVSASICDMADLSDIEVDLEIPERDISKITKGMPAKVTTDAYPDRFNNGVVDRLMPIALQSKAAIQVRVKVEMPKNEVGVYLKPGMNAKVAFLQPNTMPAQNKP